MPQVADPNAQANDMAAGIQGFTQGLGKMIGDARRVRRENEQRQQAQSNWQATFDQNKAQADQAQANWEAQMAQNKAQQALAQENWQKQYEMQKALQDFNMGRQQEQDEWLHKFYNRYFENDDLWQELQELRAKYLYRPVSDAQKVMMGLVPAIDGARAKGPLQGDPAEEAKLRILGLR